MFASAMAILVVGSQASTKPIMDDRLLRLAKTATKVEVYHCKLLPTPPVSRGGLLRERLIAVGKPKRLTLADGRKVLEQFKAIPDTWAVRDGDVVFEPTLLVRYHGRRDVDLAIDVANGRLSLDESKSVSYALQVVRKRDDPMTKNLATFLAKRAL